MLTLTELQWTLSGADNIFALSDSKLLNDLRFNFIVWMEGLKNIVTIVSMVGEAKAGT